MSQPCGICGNNSGNTPYLVREMMFGSREIFEYFQCPACSCLQLADPPADLSPYYPDNYYSYRQRHAPKLAGWKRFFKRRRTRHFLGGRSLTGFFMTKLFGPPLLDSWVKAADLGLDARILDVGCGNGFLLARLANEGFTNLTGIDPFAAKEIDAPGRFRIYRKTPEELPGSFDLVMLHHSFEHMTSPAATLKSLHDLTAPGGRVLIRIPVLGSAWREYGVDWVGIDAPRHLWLHSTRSMEILCRECGFDIESIRHDSTGYHFWGSELFRRDIPLEDERSPWANHSQTTFSTEQLRTWDEMAAELNKTQQGDQACFRLRKS